MTGPTHELPPSSLPTTPDEVDAWLDGNAPIMAATVRKLTLQTMAELEARLLRLLRTPYAQECAPYLVQRIHRLTSSKRADVQAAWWGWVEREVQRTLASLGGRVYDERAPDVAPPGAQNTDPKSKGAGQ